MDITKIRYGDLVGIGEASHGTKEYQRVRLDIIKYLYSKGPIQVFIEANYPAIEAIKIPGKTRSEFTKVVKNSHLYDFYKAPVFIELLWYLYRNKIPFFGVDIDIRGQEKLIKNPINDYIITFYKQLYQNGGFDNKFRDVRMQELMNLLHDGTSRRIFLAHNYHISGYAGFKGTRIGFATLKGSTRAFDTNSARFKTIPIDYSEQQLKSNTNSIMQTVKKFYNCGFTTASDKQEMSGDKFDYIIFIKNTHSI